MATKRLSMVAGLRSGQDTRCVTPVKYTFELESKKYLPSFGWEIFWKIAN